MEKELLELCENLENTAGMLLTFIKDLTVYLKGKDNPLPMIQPELDFGNDSKTTPPQKKAGDADELLTAVSDGNYRKK